MLNLKPLKSVIKAARLILFFFFHFNIVIKTNDVKPLVVYINKPYPI